MKEIIIKIVFIYLFFNNDSYSDNVLYEREFEHAVQLDLLILQNILQDEQTENQ